MEILMALLYCFHQMFANLPFVSKTLTGNLDLFYALGMLGIVFVIFKKKRDISLLIICALPIAIYGIIQGMVIQNVEMQKLLVNISKITICISLMILVSRKIHDFKIKKFIDYICRIYIILTPIAIVLKQNDYLWRLHDTINKYNLVRLNLFYIEPSELGFHLSIIIIMLMYLIIKEKTHKVQAKYIIYMIDCLGLLALSGAYGSSVMLFSTIVFISFIIIITKLNFKNILVGYGLIMVFAIITILFVVTKSSMYMRTVDTLNGKDSSNSYRVNVTQEFTSTAITNTEGIGVGFGNLNTDNTRKIFKSTGMTAVVAASYPYFIAEGGIFAVAYLVLLLTLLTINVGIKKNMLLANLLLFSFLYQIYGGYFTNPLNWIVYGLILSRWTPEQIQLEDNLDKGKEIIS
ncbi:hypothetical protein [Clostridium estertheticum]|uniref:hypothetical protein n=1 Tax=Clostridium estertheticum TaxID=238834 RepID=UPI001CF1361F|nr:hypothetical protein [Clostridium estertheticum]MCB2353225.1 hypothetical protein [Clostridium estertheticum]WAG41578.1 hypothetical protein LL065_02295 [Clostridium estertheticum]